MYNDIGIGYTRVRRPDPRIAASIRVAIGSAQTVVNVGAGTGSYEPTDVSVVAVEPSEVMIGQRAGDSAPAVAAIAEHLPFADLCFDVGTAFLTVHHWIDAAAGLAELNRVSRRQVILTWDRSVIAERFWFARDYFPESVELDRTLTCLDTILGIVGPTAYRTKVDTVPVPADCTDGFYAAYWARPEAYLDPVVRAGISALSLSNQRDVGQAVGRLAADLQSGAWDRRYGHLRGFEALDLGYRLVIIDAR